MTTTRKSTDLLPDERAVPRMRLLATAPIFAPAQVTPHGIVRHGERELVMHDPVSALLERSALFSGLAQDTLAEIAAAALIRRWPRGATVLKQGGRADFVHLVLQGAFKLRAGGEGSPIALRLVQAGDAIGEANAVAQIPYSFTATAVIQSEGLCWTAAKFKQFAQSLSPLALNCVALAVRRERQMIRRICAGLTENVERRIARAVVDLMIGGTDLGEQLRVGGRDIAELSDATVYTVSRVVSGWKRSGIMAGGRGRITVLDFKTLRQIAEG